MTERITEETLPASIYRKEEARKRGFFPVSQDLSSSLTLLVFIGSIALLGPALFSELLSATKAYLSNISEESIPVIKLKIFLPWIMLACVIFFAAVMAALIQRGFIFGFRPAQLGPQIWLQRTFSTRNFLNAIFLLLKFSGLIVVFLLTLWASRFSIIKTGTLNPEQIAAEFAKIIFFTGLNLSLFLLGWGIIDYIVRRIQFERSLSMTPQELKDERRAFEGDPELKKYLRHKKYAKGVSSP